MNAKSRMTKAERDFVEHLRQRIALAWPPYAEPQPLRLQDVQGAGSVQGWGFNSYIAHVTRAQSTADRHKRGDDSNSWIRGAIPIYATKADAVRAMRWEISRRLASELMAIDAMLASIEEADAQESAMWERAQGVMQPAKEG